MEDKNKESKRIKDFDDIADNEDQLYKDLLEAERKKKSPKPYRSNNNYDDESREDY